MATTSNPSTPSNTTAQGIPSNSPTGNWRHPKFDEINTRLEATTFSDKNIRRILWRLSTLGLLFAIYQTNEFLNWQTHFNLLSFLRSLLPNQFALLFYPILPILLILYALVPLRPLFATTDDLSDIPLTPKQRELLGLKPTSRPVTPGSHYITPPRYSRSATPRSMNSSRSNSPFSNRGSPLGSGPVPSSYSPTASPLFQKAMSRDAARNLNYEPTSPFSLGRSLNDSSSSLGSAPVVSPLAGKGGGVGLNNRWLYERGRRSSSSLRALT